MVYNMRILQVAALLMASQLCGDVYAQSVGGTSIFALTTGTLWQRPASASQNSIPFGPIVNQNFFSGTGVGGANYWNEEVSTGWNISNTIEVPAVAGVAANYDTWESKFHQGGTGAYSVERHFGLIDTSSVVHRYMSFAVPWDGVGQAGGVGSSPATGFIKLDKFDFDNWAGTQLLSLNLFGNTVNILNSLQFFGNNNNVVTYKQINFAGSTFLNLPYINASDQLQLSETAIGTNFIATTAAPTVSAGQIGYGGTITASGTGTCPATMSTSISATQAVAGCIIVNIAGTSRNVPFF